MSALTPHLFRPWICLLALAPALTTKSHPALAPGLQAPEVVAPHSGDPLLAIEEMTNSTGDKALELFLVEHISPEYVKESGRGELLKSLSQIRERCANAGGISAEPTGADEFRVSFETAAGFWDLHVALGGATGDRITFLELVRGQAPVGLDPFTWDDYASRLEEYESEGFCGSVLLVRGGVVVHSRGYGLANPKLGAANAPETIFAIGSTPIDFTKAAILLLEERGKLKTSDLLSKFLEGVPEDKATITLGHLMKGQSGLRNFHGIRGVDEDLDLTYIDRAEALRRILGGVLLFQPGTQRAHSHSAWGVLAAVVEEASGQSYGEFLNQHLFPAAGLERTGFYPLCDGFDDAEIAVGHGEPALGRPNTPKNWGETSWLVKGSGGMVSTATDLYKWMSAIRAGKILGPAAREKYWTGQVLAGGNDRGFLTTYTEGPRNLVVVCSNSNKGPNSMAMKIGDGLARLVMQSK